MADAILSRGSTSVTIPLDLQRGDLATARDIGKPNANIQEVGTEDPRVADDFNSQDNWTVLGTLQGSNAYADAKTLAEDLIKPRGTTGTPLQLDVSDLPNRGTYDVAPLSDSALQLDYLPGRKNIVEVQLSLQVVGDTVGGSQTAQSHASPDSGTGVKIEASGGSVTLSENLRITRTVGRPGGILTAQATTLPHFNDKIEPASDIFEIRGTFLQNAESESNTLEETIIRPRLELDTLTLHFLDSLYSLDAYSVIPLGSQASRTTFAAGEKGIVDVPALRFRVVDNSS